MRVVAVIQARTRSTRLPGKVLMPLAGKPLLQRMIERVVCAKSLDDVVVATTWNEADAPIRQLCEDMDIHVFSGHPTDLLDRHYRAGIAKRADAVVKIPSDCPLIDPAIIDRVVHRFRLIGVYDFVSNLHPATYPDGNDVEVISMPVLETAWRDALRDYEREHTTPYIWDRPDCFRLSNITWEDGRNLSMTHRFTIDYIDDYAFIDAVFRELHSEGSRPFSLSDILGLLEARPDIYRLNAHYAGVNWYRHHLGQLRTVTPDQTVRTGAR